MSTAADPTKDRWRERSTRLRDAGLRERLAAALRQAADLLEDDAPDTVPAEVERALELVDARSDALQQLGTTAAADARADLRDLHGDLREHRATQRQAVLAGIQKGLASLRDVRSSRELLLRAPEVVATALGFDRTIISQVEDGMWVPVGVYVRGDPAWAAQILEAATSEPEPLDHLLVESEMARRRAPLLVRDVEDSDEFHRRIVQASRSRSYVAAPIMPEGSVIGFLHGDHFLSQRHPDELDRDALFAFAEAFGAVFERTVMAERLRAQADRVRSLTASLEVVLEELHESELRIAPEPTPAERAMGVGAPAPPARRHRAAVGSNGRLEALLTPRELEVARLLAVGATNAEIASRLVVAEGTIKSHVKHILRKLHASNRAEAVSKYLRLSQLPSHRET